MSKSILVIDTPENCEECALCAVFMGKHYCPAKDTYVIKGERDCSCPLIPAPKKIDISKARGAYDATRIEAWNECVDKIIGGRKEQNGKS